MSAQAFRNVGFITAAMGLTAVTALALERVWPWLAWGYAAVTLTIGLVMEVIANRAERASALIADEPYEPGAAARRSMAGP